MKQNAVDLAAQILWYTALVALFIATAWYLTSCCVGCPKPPPIGPPVVVETTCKLPPVPVLPVAKTVGACDPKLFCYDAENAVAIVERDGKLRQWVQEVIARCGAEAPKPKPKPTEKPDAGSPDHAR